MRAGGLRVDVSSVGGRGLTRVFLFGPLLDQQLRQAVVGDWSCVPANLHGWHCVARSDGAAGLAEGGTVAGALVELDAEAIERLAFGGMALVRAFEL